MGVRLYRSTLNPFHLIKLIRTLNLNLLISYWVRARDDGLCQKLSALLISWIAQLIGLFGICFLFGPIIMPFLIACPQNIRCWAFAVYEKYACSDPYVN
jgi:hypothetical protein